MEIRNRTRYDKDLIIRYNKYYLTQFLRTNFILVAAITLAFSVYLIAAGSWPYALIMCGILLVYLGLTLLMQKITTKRVLKRSPLVDNPITQTYIFYDDHMVIDTVKSFRIDYTEIIKIRTAKDLYVLTDLSRKTHIVDKHGFEDPDRDVAHLNALFQSVFKGSFK